MLTKTQLRQQFRAYRESLPADAYAERCKLIVNVLLEMPLVRTSRTIHVFWPILRRREVDLRRAILEWHAEGKRIVLPVVTRGASSPQAPPLMEHRSFEGEDCLEVGPWGLQEPAGTASVPPDEIDLVIAPALGADLYGHRLGYGKGYYDAFLSGMAAPALVPVFDACLVSRLPADPHDRPARWIATESGWRMAEEDKLAPM